MANLFMRYPGGYMKALTFSYDDGVESDIRFMKIIDKYGMKATFNISAGCFAPEGTAYPAGTVHRRMTKTECYNAYSGTNHEVAIHGYTHPFLNHLPPAMMTKEIIEDRQALEDIFSDIIRGGAYPFGAYDDTVVEVLKNSGIVYCRTTRATLSFDIPTDWLRLHPTCHHREETLMELADKFIGDSNQNRASKLFYVWGHTYEFDQHDNWYVIEDFCAKFADCTDIWYCTNIELYDYVRDFKRLEFSADMKRVYNPTGTKIYFEYDRELYSVGAGETKEIG